MRLLLFSDLHCDVRAAESLVERAHSADVLIGAGDFGNMRRNVSDCIDVLKQITKPTLLVPGNNESFDELRAACICWKNATVLHGEEMTVSGRAFFGVGGGLPVTPFGAWSFDFDEVQGAQLLRDMPEGCVLISHSPPKGCVDVSSRGQSLGSTAVRDAIRVKKPALVVCGHIHGSSGQRGMIDSTPVVNAGPAGVEWELK